jgi:hypothetical protein
MLETEQDTLSTEDATLLLYVAGELGEAERRAIDARLKTDAAFRDRLAAMSSFDEAMRADVDARPVAVADSRRALSVSLRLVREQALLLQSRPMARSGLRLAGIPRWVWGTAAAACVAVVSLVWISNSDPSVPTPRQTQTGGGPGGFPMGGEIREFSAAFLPIPAENSQVEGQANDINSEVDALNLLAVMNEPGDNDAN